MDDMESSILPRVFRRHNCGCPFLNFISSTFVSGLTSSAGSWLAMPLLEWAPETSKNLRFVFEPITHSPLPSICLDYPSLPHARPSQRILRKVTVHQLRFTFYQTKSISLRLYTAVRFGSMVAVDAVIFTGDLTNSRRFKTVEKHPHSIFLAPHTFQDDSGCRNGYFQRRPGTSLHTP